MVTYKVTTELKTSWWLKLLRFLRIKNKREEFKIYFNTNMYQKGDILSGGIGVKLKVLSYE